MEGAGTYSPVWYATFLATIPGGQTEHEAAFIERQLPRSAFARLLDLCCGPGRHTAVLAARGYRVTGLDHDAAVVEAGRSAARRGEEYMVGDMRRLEHVAGPFDGVLCLWQSFGWFDEATNRAILCAVRERLRPGGRLVLDIYHREFFEGHTGERVYTRAGRRIRERKHMQGARLSVDLEYDGQPGDRFEWQLYTPAEISREAARCGFSPILVCSGFDEATPASADGPRMQIVLQK